MDMRLIREKELLRRLPISRTTLWRMCSRGEFPQPFRLSARIKVWDLSEVEETILKFKLKEFAND